MKGEGEKLGSNAGYRITSSKSAAISPLVAADIDELIALAGEIWYQHYPAIISTAQIEYMLGQRYNADFIQAELHRTDVWWDQLRDRDRMIGFASYFRLGADEMKLDKLYVHHARQRQGHGGMLLDRAARVAREQGCRTLALAVNKHNASAIAAYEKYGFRTVESVVKDIGCGFVMDDYVMAKDI